MLFSKNECELALHRKPSRKGAVGGKSLGLVYMRDDVDITENDMSDYSSYTYKQNIIQEIHRANPLFL